jgi:glycosyltransferase involved in cell wall biosynthesis
LKILITTDAFPPGGGGSAQSTAALARVLAGNNHQVSVVVGRRNVLGELRKDWEGVAVIEVGLGKSSPGRTGRELRLASFLEKWSPSERFDLVHAQHWLSAKATVQASRKVGFPVVVTVRDYWPVCIWSTKLSGHHPCPGCSTLRRVLCVGRRYPWAWPAAPILPFAVGRELGRRMATLRNASAAIAVSRHVQRSLPVDHSVVIPNLLDLADLESRLAGPVSANLPERFAFFAGKLELNKAPDRLLPILRASGIRLPLVIAGTGTLESSIRDEASRLGMEVHWLGWRDPDEVLRLMRRSVAVVFPSRWEEPLSRVLLEGLGVGAVMVVEPTGGTDEMVVDGESGLVGRNVTELAEALARVSTDEGLASRLREGAIQRAREHFSTEAVLPQVEKLYRRVMEGGPVEG